jgi:glutamate-5-semialdehyde dehydrogenase
MSTMTQATRQEDGRDSAGNQADAEMLTTLTAGMRVLYDGNKLAQVPDAIVARFRAGDRLLVVDRTGEVLHVPHAAHRLATAAVDRAREAFVRLLAVDDTAITRFYREFATRLADETIWRRIALANEADVAAARARGRPTTRLVAGEAMRRTMLRGLGEWETMASPRGATLATVRHDGWDVEQVRDGLGVVGFVFEGRPNVFADATGILRTGNTAVMRIGSDALGTARTITEEALNPALDVAGLPAGAITLLDSADHASGWALFSDPRLALAVARGSGRAVAQLGSIARQAGIPASLHGTGGAWLVADESAESARFYAALYHSLDRKVCNTANVVLIPARRAAELAEVALGALQARGKAAGHGYKLHVASGAEPYVPAALFTTRAAIMRAEGPVEEPIAEPLTVEGLAQEWEWEATPEISLAVVRDLDEAISLFNTYSPQFIASLIASNEAAHDRFFRAVNAPFVGDGMTRWVDGQYALNRPELGLSNWQAGRLFGRGGVLSGDGVYTIRLRAHQRDPDLHR